MFRGGRRRSNFLLYGFVLLSAGFFVFVFLSMPSSGPNVFGDLQYQTQFVSTSRTLRRNDVDRPTRFRPRTSTKPIPRSSSIPRGLAPQKQHEPPPQPEQVTEPVEEVPAIERQDNQEQYEEPPPLPEQEPEIEEQTQQPAEEEEEAPTEERKEEPPQEDPRKITKLKARGRPSQGEEDEASEKRRHDRLVQGTQRRLSKASSTTAIPKSILRIAMTSAFKGDRYIYMARLTGETKHKYAAIHGYTFFEDNDLIPDDASWNARSAIRTQALLAHFDNFDWVYWSDVDIMITNPRVKLESFIRTGAHVILSRDWGDRQVNPGSILMKTSEFSRRFIQQWEQAIVEVTDDLRAFEKVMAENPEYESKGKVVYLRQQLINPYHHVETNAEGQLVRQPQPHPDGHDLWKEDSLLVHIINCLRTSRNDCQILADYYYRIAMQRFQKLGYPLTPYLDQ